MGVEEKLRRLRPGLRRVVGKYPIRVRDDLMAVGMVAAWQGLLAGIDAERMLLRRAKWAMQDYLRSVRPGKRWRPVTVLSMTRPPANVTDYEDMDGNEYLVPSECPSPEELLAQKQQIERVNDLPLRLRRLIQETLAGRSQSALAVKLGVTPSRVSQLVARGVKVLHS